MEDAGPSSQSAALSDATAVKAATFTFAKRKNRGNMRQKGEEEEEKEEGGG